MQNKNHSQLMLIERELGIAIDVKSIDTWCEATLNKKYLSIDDLSKTLITIKAMRKHLRKHLRNLIDNDANSSETEIVYAINKFRALIYALPQKQPCKNIVTRLKNAINKVNNVKFSITYEIFSSVTIRDLKNTPNGISPFLIAFRFPVYRDRYAEIKNNISNVLRRKGIKLSAAKIQFDDQALRIYVGYSPQELPQLFDNLSKYLGPLQEFKFRKQADESEVWQELYSYNLDDNKDNKQYSLMKEVIKNNIMLKCFLKIIEVDNKRLVYVAPHAPILAHYSYSINLRQSNVNIIKNRANPNEIDLLCLLFYTMPTISNWHFFSRSKLVALNESTLRTAIDFKDLKKNADLYYSLHKHYADAANLHKDIQSFDKQNIKLVIGEQHQDSHARDCIVSLLSILKINNTPIFLEFLVYETWMPILNEYYKDNLSSEKVKQIEQVMTMILEKDAASKGLCDIIIAARKSGVKVYPAETIISHMGTHSYTGGSKENRCRYSNYASANIVRQISPDNFVMLYGNGHLLKGEAEEPPLHKMLGAKAISFISSHKEDLEKECEFVFEKFNNNIFNTISQKMFQDKKENKENNETSILHAAKLKQQEKENSQIIFSIADCDLKTAGSWAQQITAITFILKQKKLPWHIDKNSKLNIPNSKYVIEHNQDPAKNITVQKTGNKITISAAAKQVASDVAMRYIILTQAIQKARSLQTRKIKIYGASKNLFKELKTILQKMCKNKEEFILVDAKKHDCKVKI